MLNAAKSLLTSSCVGFVRNRGAREAKKKGFSHLPPASITFSEKNKHLLRGVSPQPPHFKSLAAPPPLCLGKLFVFSIPWLVSDLMYIICLFMHLRILSGGAERQVCSLPYLICFKVLFFSTLFFVRNQFLIPHLFQSTQRWALLYMSQASKSICGFASTLPLQWLKLYGFLKKEIKSKRSGF